MLRIVADIAIIRRIRRIRRIMFSGKIEKYLVIHKKDKIADVADIRRIWRIKVQNPC